MWPVTSSDFRHVRWSLGSMKRLTLLNGFVPVGVCREAPLGYSCSLENRGLVPLSQAGAPAKWVVDRGASWSWTPRPPRAMKIGHWLLHLRGHGSLSQAKRVDRVPCPRRLDRVASPPIFGSVLRFSSRPVEPWLHETTDPAQRLRSGWGLPGTQRRGYLQSLQQGREAG